MPTFFTINKLDGEYNWKDFEFCDLAFDYAVDIHNIPEEYIQDVAVSIKERKVEITLLEDINVVNEDWYHTLLQYIS